MISFVMCETGINSIEAFLLHDLFMHSSDFIIMQISSQHASSWGCRIVQIMHPPAPDEFGVDAKLRNLNNTMTVIGKKTRAGKSTRKF